MTIGENIRRIRKEKGITQKELGERLDMTQSAIGQLKHSNEIKSTVKYLEFIDFLKSSGYSYDYQVTKWHYGEVI